MSLSVPQLAAAAVLVASLSGGFAWLAGSREAAAVSDEPLIAARAPEATSGGPRTVSAGGESLASSDYYAASIVALESLLFDSARPLPAEADARIRRALSIIDRAIEDARAALIDMPDDPYLREHVTNTMRRKSDYLRDAVRIAAQS